MVLMSGVSELPLESIYNLGARGVIPKPLRPKDVIAALKRASPAPASSVGPAKSRAKLVRADAESSSLT
ncbi:MAG: hypothetical protein ABL958_14465 [Bdellovibrionia bacterium]